MADAKNKTPFLDLVTMHQELEPELVAVFQSVLRTAGFVGGPLVEGFERDFARFCGNKHCVGLASGTDAVRFALMAAGVQPVGDSRIGMGDRDSHRTVVLEHGLFAVYRG